MIGLLLKGRKFLMKDLLEVPRPILMKKVNGTLRVLESLIRLGTPSLRHFGVSTSNLKQKYFIAYIDPENFAVLLNY